MQCLKVCGYLGNQFGQQIDNGFQSRGMNPYSTPNYGSSNDYGSSFGNIPEAPPFDLYNSSPSGYGNIPEAPPLGNIGGGSRGGYYGGGSRNNGNSYPMQEPQNGRAALMNDIRNFRRAPSNQPQSGYGNIPEAPPFDLYNSAPSSSPSLMSEFQNRASQPGMGLRPTQTRAPGAYPSEGGNSMMDLMRNRLGDIRRDVEPGDYRRNYTVMGV
jgi:hypothetical protein